MSDNKVDNKLDFRNMKKSQFGGTQIERAEFSELQSAKRTFTTTPILKDGYTHFIQTTNVDTLPTFVEYWQATSSAKDKLTMSADSGGSKTGTYFTLQEYLTKKTHTFWYRVSGSGTAPGVGDIETAIDIATNDSAALIAYATNIEVNTTDEFTSSHPSVLSSFIEIEYFQFGDTDAIDVGTSGFISSRLIEGLAFKVGEVCIEYTVEGYPIYGGNTLKGLLYNPYTASFDVERDRLTVDVDMTPLVAKEPTIYNVAMAVAGTEYNLTLPLDTKQVQAQIQDHKGKYTISWATGGPVWTKKPGNSYEVSGLELEITNNTIYFIGTKDNIIMEIIAWK